MGKVSKADPLKKLELKKKPTGIQGFDEVTGGGLPLGRPTLLAGGPGCGKTLAAMEFLVRGAVQFHEPGVFMAFEETPLELEENFASFGFDIPKLVARKILALEHVHIERSEIEETGEYNLEGLFIRLEHAIKSVKAKRVVLDTIEALFSGFSQEALLRAELRRLFRWLKERHVTAIITAERGENGLTKYGLEEYVADCVILLDNRMINQIATRRLRIIKYRGTMHGANEYPFLFTRTGMMVMPITSNQLNHPAPRERISTGIAALDGMMGNQGYFRGSSILVSGTAGAGKTTLAAHFLDAACRRHERCLYFAFEESEDQIIRNMSSVGIDLQPWIKKKLLRFSNNRPTTFGLEMHLSEMHRQILEFKPDVVVVDPVSNLISSGA